MKKLCICLAVAVAVMLAFVGNVAAEETSVGGRNSYHYHTHEYIDIDTDTDTDTWRPPAYVPERRNPVGVGVDALVWEDGNYGAEVQYRYDGQNSEHSTYLVGQVNIFKLLGGE